MRLAIVNAITQTASKRWVVPQVISNRQCIAMQLGRALASQGDEVTVIAADPFRPVVADEGVETEYLPVKHSALAPPAELPQLVGLVDFIRGNRFDAVVTSEVFQWNTLMLAYSNQSSMPPLFLWHEADRYQRMAWSIPARAYYQTAGRHVLKRAAGVLPRSATARDFLLRNGCPIEKLGPQIPNGFDEQVFYPKRSQRASFPELLYVGSLIERKGPDLAISALPIVQRAYPEAVLRLKGTGEWEPELRRMAQELGVENSVVFDTKRSDLEEMAELYNSAWLGIFPSRRDFATLSPLEAAGCGVPIVVSSYLAHAKYVQKTGIGAVADDSAISLAAGVLKILETRGVNGLDDATVTSVHKEYGLREVATRLSRYIERTIME